MRTIWKFTISPNCTLEMPVGAEILDIQVQHGEPQMWVLVDPFAPIVKRSFNVYRTGQQLDDDVGLYIGTFLVFEGNLDCHVFEKYEPI